MSSGDVPTKEIFDTIHCTVETAPVRTGTDLKGSQLIGVWAKRTDVKSWYELARRLRREAEQRRT